VAGAWGNGAARYPGSAHGKGLRGKAPCQWKGLKV